jgi:hypothetical protein
MLGCTSQDSDTCGLTSTISGYIPDCTTAGIAFYDDETRAAIGGEGGYLVVYLPAELEAGEVYGGMTGSPLSAILTLSDGRELVSIPRQSTVRVASVGPRGAELGLSLSLDEGDIEGAVTAPTVE